ncbi:MAG: DUF2155 domain-containing protein [Leptospirillia bacterium]
MIQKISKVLAVIGSVLLLSVYAAHAEETASPHGASPHGSMPPTGGYGADPHANNPMPHSATQADHDAQTGQTEGHAKAGKKRPTKVPDSVAGKWRAVTLIVLDRERSDATEITVPLKGEHTFGDGNMQVKVIEFLPDLRIDNNIYTSASNDPNNPAARVVITENGNELFDGWLFSEFPQLYGFQHARFGVTLKAGIPN